MPQLPENQPWPIPPWGDAALAWRENDAWYTGDVERLAYIYGHDTGTRATHRVRGQEHHGGLVGALSRTFWGRPVPPGEDRTRLHIPAAGDIATLSSDLLFSEPPTIAYDSDDEATGKAQDRLDQIMNSDEAHAWMQEGGEYCAAFGATALTTVWDESRDAVWVQPSAADVAIPEFRYGKLTALNLWSQFRDRNTATFYRHVERHESGAIYHSLYQGTESNLGRMVPLQDRPETEGFASLVNAEGFVETGIKRLTASWWLNMPARAWRKRGVLAEAGRSDYTGGVKGLMDALDEAWSSWMRDLELGKARLIVPRGYLESNGRGRGASFDPDRSIYSPLDLPGAAQANVSDSIEQVQFDIRVEAHEQTTQALYRRILAAAGYGELDKETASAVDRTATEINVQGQSKARTREKKALFARQALADVSQAAMELDGVKYSGKGGGAFAAPEVVFRRPQPDPQQVAQSIALLRSAQAISIRTSVKLQHSDWSDPQVDEEVATIQRERGIVDPTTVGDPRLDPSLQPVE